MEKNINFQKDKNQNKNKNLRTEKLTKISKQMTYILRHKAKDFGLNIEPSGYVKLDELLNIQMIKSHKLTLDMVKEIVEKDSKQRFSLENRPPYYIRANQGHSMQDVKNEECLEPLINYADFQYIVHGTNREAWEKIKLSGLNKMNRNCIHFAIGYPKDKEVISGMRVSCDVFVEIDIIRAVENGIPFYISGNKVILTPGINGILPVEFFFLVKTSKNDTLYQQKYDYVVYFNFKSNDPNQIESILIIDLTHEAVVKEFNFSDSLIEREIVELDKLIDYLKEQKLFKEKIIVTFSHKNVENYNTLITNTLNTLRYRSFFMIYIPNEKDIDQKEILSQLSQNKACFTSQNAKRLLVTSANNNKIIDKNQFNNEMNYDKMIIDETNKSFNFNEKTFLMLDVITFEDSDMICSLDFIVFKPQEKDNTIVNSSEFNSKSNKENMTKFIENVNNILSLIKIKEGDLFTIINAEALERIKRIAKQNLIKLPKYFCKNLFIYDKNHIEFANKNLNDKAEVFTLEYLNDQQKLNTIKLII